jgi:hypothetical protein
MKLFLPLLLAVAMIPARAAAPATELSTVVKPQLAECADGCTVRLPAGDLYASEPVVIDHPGVRLVGEGAKATRLHFTGPAGSAAIDLRMRPFTIDSHSAIQGLSIQLETPGTTAILTGDVTSATFRDLFIQCNHQPRSHGILARLEQGWFERNLFEEVDVKYCSAGLEMSMAPGARFSSFGYNKFMQFGLNLGAGQKGVVIGPGVMVYHSILNWNVNIDDGGLNDGTEFIHVEGTVQSNRYDISGESAKPSIGIRVLRSGVWKNEPASTIMLDNMTVPPNVPAPTVAPPAGGGVRRPGAI